VLRIGQAVMLIQREPGMPRIGIVGEVLGFDGVDYDVEFPSHPCLIPPGTFWVCAPEWLVPLEPVPTPIEQLEQASP
jgi:hypothetical protein